MKIMQANRGGDEVLIILYESAALPLLILVSARLKRSFLRAPRVLVHLLQYVWRY